MRTWKDKCEKLGAVMAAEPVICNHDPDAAGAESCKALGSALA